MYMQRYWRLCPLLAAISLLLLLFSGCSEMAPTTGTAQDTISVVAAENFYGDIVKQIGGKHVSVTSIISDPNVDPHQYETNVKQVKAVANAQLVIENSGGYDGWMDRLLSSTTKNDRSVIKAFDIAKNKLPENVHVWYSIDNIQVIAQNIADDLKKIDGAHAQDYDLGIQTFKQSLGPIQQKIATIKTHHANTPVALTETIFQYQAVPLGLKVLTPQEFQKAIAEGNDPPANTVAITEDQIQHRQVKVLIYNEQTQSSITTKLQNEAKAQNIPVVPVTETMPANKTYQTWMLGQLEVLENSLGK